MTRRRAALLIGVATAAVFAKAAANGFVSFDDGVYITQNPHVLAGLTWPGLRWAFTTFAAGNWHPVTWISHMLDASLFGADPFGHHAAGVLLHSLNAALVFLLFDRMTGATGRAAACAALFAVHPLRVESVAWASERKDLLAAFFGLLALLAYVRAARDRSPRALWAGVGFYAAGLMAKPTLVGMPFLLAAMDFWPLDRLARETPMPRQTAAKKPPPSWKALLLEKVPFVALAAGLCVVTLAAQRRGGATSALAVPLPARLGNAAIAVVRYLGKTLAPTDLAALYPHPLVLEPARTAAALAIIAAVTAACIALRRERPYLLFGWTWFLASVSPTLGFVQVGWQAMADRYTYLPSIGLAVIIVWGSSDLLLPRVPRKALAVGAVFCLLLLSALTIRQIGFWRDSLTLWQHALAATRNNVTAELNLGGELLKAHRAEEALVHLARASQLAPNDPGPEFSLGAAYASLGRYADSQRAYEEALRLSPSSAAIHLKLGELLASQGRWAEALPHFEAQVRLEPSSPGARYNLALALERLGRVEEAIQELRLAVASSPRDPRPEEELRRLLRESPGGRREP